ncbi:GNAT family N-acetyltransferase [Alloscardovia macacae]|nr:N-acetyltransferase [Alloscardovia macacae]
MMIRHATLHDLEQLAALEAEAFPGEEAASEQSIRERIQTFPECFWIAEACEENQTHILAAINGMCTHIPDLMDEMYEKASLHDPHGEWQMIFSVASAKDHRGEGYPSRLMNALIDDAQIQKRKGIVLTCKEALIGFYERFGFVDEGVSSSEHGGAVWHQMRLTL